MRFSNDKTPYKTGFSASFSRSGRKGIFAHCACIAAPALSRASLIDMLLARSYVSQILSLP